MAAQLLQYHRNDGLPGQPCCGREPGLPLVGGIPQAADEPEAAEPLVVGPEVGSAPRVALGLLEGPLTNTSKPQDTVARQDVVFWGFLSLS